MIMEAAPVPPCRGLAGAALTRRRANRANNHFVPWRFPVFIDIRIHRASDTGPSAECPFQDDGGVWMP